MFTGSKMFTGTGIPVQKHRGMRGEPYRGERYPTHARARLARLRGRGACADVRCAELTYSAGAHCILGGEPNGKTEGEAKADFMRWSSGAPCNLATCDVL